MRYDKKARMESELDNQVQTQQSMYERPYNKPRLGTIDALDMFNFDSVRDLNHYESYRIRSNQA